MASIRRRLRYGKARHYAHTQNHPPPNHHPTPTIIVIHPHTPSAPTYSDSIFQRQKQGPVEGYTDKSNHQATHNIRGKRSLQSGRKSLPKAHIHRKSDIHTEKAWKKEFVGRKLIPFPPLFHAQLPTSLESTKRSPNPVSFL